MSENKPSPDPRLDPRFHPIIEALMAPRNSKDSPNPNMPVEELREVVKKSEGRLYKYGLKFIMGDVPTEGIKSYQVDIAVPGRKDPLKLFINRPDDDRQYPAFIWCHGGGMAYLRAFMYEPIARFYARAGLVVIVPDFRNSTTAPFPAGLDDCFATLLWVVDHTHHLGSPPNVVIGGESGGGNLAVATAMLAKDGGVSALKGLYVMCPFIGGSIHSQSYTDFDGYFITKERALALYKLYFNDAIDDRKHLAFPYFATRAHLVGLVDTVVVVNECDPLKDEGVQLFRNLLAAGVAARLVVSGGSVHGAELYCAIVPEIVEENAIRMTAFASRVTAPTKL